jgi:8-oxo-dGTP diphosphatase
MKYPMHIVAVGGLITNEEGQVLLILHPKRGWEFPGGQVEVGEDLTTALEREVTEETGIVVTVERLVGIYQNIKEESENITTKVMFDFLGRRTAGEIKTREESIEVGWFSREEALTKITHPVIYDRLKEMLNFAGRVRYRAYSKDPYQIYKESFL